MSLIPRFIQYAAAFEKAYASGDMSILEPYFTDDVSYNVPLPGPLAGRVHGRDALFTYFRNVLDGFDRRFSSRTLRLIAGPREENGAVWIRGGALYTAPGLPDLDFILDETATFQGDRICNIEDHYAEADEKVIVDYLAAYGNRLGIVPI